MYEDGQEHKILVLSAYAQKSHFIAHVFISSSVGRQMFGLMWDGA